MKSKQDIIVIADECHGTTKDRPICLQIELYLL